MGMDQHEHMAHISSSPSNLVASMCHKIVIEKKNCYWQWFKAQLSLKAISTNGEGEHEIMIDIDGPSNATTRILTQNCERTKKTANCGKVDQIFTRKFV